MSVPEARDPRPDRRWVPWTVTGAVAAVAIAAAFVFVPLLASGEPAATPSPTAPEPTPTPTATPTPTCQVADVDGTWRSLTALDLPADGALTETVVATAPGESITDFLIDDDLFGFVADGPWGSTNPGRLHVVERSTGTIRWEAEVPQGTTPVATPQSAGLDGTIVVTFPRAPEDPATTDPQDYTSTLRMFDLSSGQVLAEHEIAGDWAGGIAWSPGLAGRAEIAPADVEAFFVTTRDVATRFDALTLEPTWSVAGDDFGVGHFEGGVPFRYAGDVLFVGGHAVDAATGDALGWQADASPLVAGGHVLTTPIVYDSPDPYLLSGLDTRTGEACWSHEIVSVAGDDDEVWIVTSDQMLLRIDPATGDVVEDRGTVGDVSVNLYGETLVLTTRLGWDSIDAVAEQTVLTDGGSWLIPTSNSGGNLRSSGDQLVLFDWGTASQAPQVTAYDPAQGDTVWTAEIDWSATNSYEGVVLETTPGGDGTVQVTLLH